MHVEVGEAAAVRMKLVYALERGRIAHDHAAVRRARAQHATGRAHAHLGRRCRRRQRALDEYAVRLLVSDRDLTQNAQPFDVEVEQEVAVAAQQEALLLCRVV